MKISAVDAVVFTGFVLTYIVAPIGLVLTGARKIAPGLDLIRRARESECRRNLLDIELIGPDD